MNNLEGRLDLPPITLESSHYKLEFVDNPEDLEKLFRFRFQIFNLEFKQQDSSSHKEGIEKDHFDPYFHQMVVWDTDTDEIVGTYRLQNFEMAQRNKNFVSSYQYDFSTFPMSILQESVEVGRACVHKEHRNRVVLSLLWKGLARYITFYKKRYFFGCCSLSNTDVAEAYQVWCDFKKRDCMSKTCQLLPRLECQCFSDDYTLDEPRVVKIPKLFEIYLSYYGQICGPPSLDRIFGTIDFLILTDIKDFDEKSYELFFIR